MIKEFLIDKLNDYHTNTLAEIRGKLTSNMPTWETEQLEGNELPFWGFEDDGIWVIWPTYMGGYVFDLDIVYYANNGEVHTIGSKYDKDYFDLYKNIYESNSVRVLKPIICEEVITDNDYLPKNSWYYICFQNPDNLLGITIESQSFEQTPSKVYQNLKDHIDLIAKLIIALKTNTGGLLPRELRMFYIFLDSNGLYYTLFNKCTVPCNDAIDGYLEILQDTLMCLTVDIPKDEILHYARTKWLA